MLYWPQLKTPGDRVPLSLAIRAFRIWNSVSWPLVDRPRWHHIALDRCIVVFCVLGCVLHVEAEIRYFLRTLDNLDDLLTGVPTHFILWQIIICCAHYRLTRQKFRVFLERFYRDIYLHEVSNARHFANIRRRLRPIHLHSLMYAIVCSCYLLVPILNEIYHRRDLLYKMILPIDHEPWPVYWPTICYNMYIGVFVTTVLIGEDNLLSEYVLHLEERYKMLRESFQADCQRVLRDCRDSSQIVRQFRQQIVRSLRGNIELNAFAEDLERQCSFRIFIIFAFSALMLCGLGFKVYTNPVANIPYMFWICGKVLEMLIIGHLGSSLKLTTESLGSMYYESDWHLCVEMSNDSGENVRLMKLIQLAIATNQKPFQLRGMNFFYVSLDAVIKIIQGAGSYFTCLIALR